MSRRLVLLDSIARIDSAANDQVVVSGSHGGASAAKFVLQLNERPHVVFYNDAGVGKDRAGIVALDMLEAAGLACATYSHESACIGNAQDGHLNGIVTHLNERAAALGIRPGDRVRDLVQRLVAGTPGA
jgi:hypothetical protein